MQTYKFLSFSAYLCHRKNIKSVYHEIIIIFIRKSKSDANEQEKQDKKNFDILKYDGIRARNMGKLPYAIKCFEEAVALQEEKETLGLLASAYLQANRTEDARITLDRLIAQDETNVQALLSLASVCYIQEDYEGMDKACQKAIALDEKNAQAYYLAARAARGLKMTCKPLSC